MRTTEIIASAYMFVVLSVKPCTIAYHIDHFTINISYICWVLLGLVKYNFLGTSAGNTEEAKVIELLIGVGEGRHFENDCIST